MVRITRDPNSPPRGLARSITDILFGFVSALVFMAVYLNSSEDRRLGSNNGDVGMLQEAGVKPGADATYSGLSLSAANALSAAKDEKRDFLEIGLRSGTDKVRGQPQLERCLEDSTKCTHPAMENPKCRTGAGHFYHTMYNKVLGKYSTDDAEPFQFLEVGYYNGKGMCNYPAPAACKSIAMQTMLYKELTIVAVILITNQKVLMHTMSSYPGQKPIAWKLLALSLAHVPRVSGHGGTLQQRIQDIKSFWMQRNSIVGMPMTSISFTRSGQLK
jgi:hypothetical protein